MITAEKEGNRVSSPEELSRDSGRRPRARSPDRECQRGKGGNDGVGPSDTPTFNRADPSSSPTHLFFFLLQQERWTGAPGACLSAVAGAGVAGASGPQRLQPKERMGRRACGQRQIGGVSGREGAKERSEGRGWRKRTRNRPPRRAQLRNWRISPYRTRLSLCSRKQGGGGGGITWRR
jgi:hypothetical protein